MDQRVAIFAALAEPTRLRIVDLLTLGDLSSSEIGRRLSLTSNLVAHHLRVLESALIISRTKSEFDRRRGYIGLRPEVFASLTAGPLTEPTRVLFVCTGNSARSQLAEAIWTGSQTIPAASAGTHPADEVNPDAVATARRHGLRIAPGRTPQAVADVVAEGDLVITVCDSAHEQMKGRDDLHWSIPDPAALGTADAFETAFQLIDRRVRTLASRLAAAA